MGVAGGVAEEQGGLPRQRLDEDGKRKKKRKEIRLREREGGRREVRRRRRQKLEPRERQFSGEGREGDSRKLVSWTATARKGRKREGREGRELLDREKE